MLRPTGPEVIVIDWAPQSANANEPPFKQHIPMGSLALTSLTDDNTQSEHFKYEIVELDPIVHTRPKESIAHTPNSFPWWKHCVDCIVSITGSLLVESREHPMFGNINITMIIVYF